MRDIWTIAKKELRGCFRDKAILALIIFVPFLIVYGYSLLMSVTATSEPGASTDENKPITAYSIHTPASLEESLRDMNIKSAEPGDADAIRDQIAEEECDLLIVFDEDFEIAAPGTAMEELSGIEIWYNSSREESYTLYNQVSAYLSALQPTVFLVNADENTVYNLVDETDEFLSLLGIILPMMLLMAVFMVCMNLAAESIAGDKERGFLNTMLLVPVRRSAIALGKSVCIFIAAIVGGLSAFAGMALSLPKLTSAMGFEGDVSYSVVEYLMLFLVTMTAVFALASILLLVSTLSKDVKQATNIAPIFLMVVLIGSMLTMSEPMKSTVEDLGTVNYIIPVWNASRMLQNLMELNYTVPNLLLTCLSNLAFAGIALFIVGRCFESEKIVNG